MISIVKAPNAITHIGLTKKQWQDTGLDLRKFILDRTKSGIDMDGKPFKEYSSQHAKKRAEDGKETGVVNLEFDAKMQNSLAVESKDDSTELYYSNAQRAKVAYKHQRGINVPERKHFGLSEKDISELTRKIFGIITLDTKRQWTK